MTNHIVAPEFRRHSRYLDELPYERDAAPKRFDAAWSFAGVLFLTAATTVLVGEGWPNELVTPSEAAENTAPSAMLIAPRPNFAALAADVEVAPLSEGDVRILQTKLQALGFAPGEIDGIAGGRTLDALNAFRQSQNLARVTKVDYGTTAGLLD